MTSQELRNSILQLAIQGKLVEQRPEEGSGEELYQEIQAEKRRLIKAGKIKREKPLPEITENEIPFDIPENWKWVRVGNITSLNPKNILDDNINVAFIPMPCVADGFRNQHTFEVRKWQKIKKGFTHFSNGDIGIAKITPCFQNRKSVIFKELENGCGAGSTELSIVRAIKNTLVREYLLWFFKTNYFIVNGVKSFAGTAGQQRIHKDFLKTCLIPLPPLAEQKRIVARIEELLPYIDRYEQAWSKLEEFNKRFPDDMQKSLLQYAIQGKLVEQRPEEGSGEKLYQEIQAEKRRLIKAGKIKRGKPLPEITEDDIPFDIPENWKWVRLRTLVYSRGQEVPSSLFSYIDIGSIDNENQRLNAGEYIIQANKAPSRARKIVELGDILYSTVRPYLHNMCIIDRQFSCKPIASTGFAAMTCHNGVYNKYLFYYLMSPSFDNYANHTENAKGVAYPAINDSRLYRAVVPLPPLSEQKRIVAKLEELLPLCEKLKK